MMASSFGWPRTLGRRRSSRTTVRTCVSTFTAPNVGGSASREDCMTDGTSLRPGDRLLLATTSAGKQRELRALLGDLPLTLVTPADLGLTLVPDETGTTFAANASIKAQEYHAAAGGLPTLAE